MTSPGSCAFVDHRFFASGRNWARARVALARGDGGELGERREMTKLSTELRRRRAVAATGGGAQCSCGTESGGEGGEGQEARELTLSAVEGSRKDGEARGGP